ncbi:hypothetical protein TNCV_759471 [Trichonephila clavipes]|nr:hypothetical protein TNCV_759471 [Trichonephila clavipes]
MQLKVLPESRITNVVQSNTRAILLKTTRNQSRSLNEFIAAQYTVYAMVVRKPLKKSRRLQFTKSLECRKLEKGHIWYYESCTMEMAGVSAPDIICLGPNSIGSLRQKAIATEIIYVAEPREPYGGSINRPVTMTLGISSSQ